MYCLDNSVIEKFAEKIVNIDNLYINVLDQELYFIHDEKYKINNQGGELQESNFLGRNLEFSFKYNEEEYNVAVQLYLNDAGYYRVFVMGKDDKMWTSVNLSTGLVDENIEFDIQIRVTSPQSDSKEQRAARRDTIINELRKCGLKADKRNHVYFGAYNIEKDEFINTTPEKFIKDLLTIAVCKMFVK